jgi:hypothetical protein
MEEVIVFVTSPSRVTPYHIVRNVNFLLQVRGSKTIHVFDRYDRDVITAEELERNWTVNDDDVSVSLSVNFQYEDRCLGSIHRANYFLRRAGLTPTPPGVSPANDRAKTRLAPPLVRAATGAMRSGDRLRSGRA